MRNMTVFSKRSVQSLLLHTRRSRLLEYLTYGLCLRAFNALNISKSLYYYKLALLGEPSENEGFFNVIHSNQYSLSIEPWPYARIAAMTINFDDISPVNERGFTDFGGNVAGVVVRRFEEFMVRFPQVRVTHFVPARMSYDPVRERFSIQGGSIDDPRFKEWREWLKEWVSSGRVEVGLHGVQHYNRSTASPAEFNGLDYGGAKELMQESINLMLRAGFAPCGFRPPAWGLGNSECVVGVAKDLGLSYVAASGVGIGLNKGKKSVSDLVPSWYQGILNIPQNVILGLNSAITHDLASAIISRRGLISIKGHFAGSYYLAASLNASNFRWLNRFLESLSSKSDDIWFATASEIAGFKAALASVELIPRSSHVYLVRNNSRFPIAGLTLKTECNRPCGHGEGNDLSSTRTIILPNLSPFETLELDIMRGSVVRPS